ncbi:type IIL restriction-modification enzyme MmeI [Roseovarius sp. D0-M9]|uniref:type IIL restriction-modification enzyme MmeI n=1 Tax=Roseovarius sp. D0-M9 TaxID=3127117 RepID=UPI00300FD549
MWERLKHRCARLPTRNEKGPQGKIRYCLWIDDADRERAMSIPAVAARVRDVEEYRRTTKDKSANSLVDRPHQFREMKTSTNHTVIVPGLSSERREYVPAALLPASTVVSLTAFSILDAATWNIAILCSKLHYVWNFTFGGKMKSDVRYSNSLCWNTFPVPKLTEADKANLTRCAEDILLAREAHFPATIAELYDPEKMPDDLRAAHDRNDETLERIYIGRRFRNDTERLEKLFDMYTKMTAKKEKAS